MNVPIMTLWMDWHYYGMYLRFITEDPALPAVIILTMPFLTPGGKVVTLGEVPMVKPAGVRIEFEVLY